MVCCCVFPLYPLPSSGLSRARERQLERRPKPQTSTVDLPDPEPQTANLTNPKNPNCGSSVGSNPTNPNCGSSVGSNLFVAQVLFCSKVICSSMCGSCNIVFSSAWDYRRFLPIPVVSDRPKMFWTNQCLSDLSEALGFLSVNFVISYWRKYLFSPFDRKLVTDFSLFSNDP